MEAQLGPRALAAAQPRTPGGQLCPSKAHLLPEA